MAAAAPTARLVAAWEARVEHAWKAMLAAQQVLELLSLSVRHREEDKRRAPAEDEMTDWLLAKAQVDAARADYNECLSVLEIVTREAAAAAVRRGSDSPRGDSEAGGC